MRHDPLDHHRAAGPPTTLGQPKASGHARTLRLPFVPLTTHQRHTATTLAHNAGKLRYYEPGFVLLTSDGMHYIVETKGLEDTNVANKDRAARLWCENATQLTGKSWPT